MTKKDKKLIKLIIILTLIVFIPFGIIIWYSQPLDEILVCDMDFNCKVKTTRFFNIQTVKTFDINKLSSLTTYYTYSSHSRVASLRMTGHNYYIKIDDIKPFSHPVCKTSDYDNNYELICKPALDNIFLEFNKYQRGITNNFTTTSVAQKFYFWYWLGFLFAAWLLLTHLTITTDLDFYKEYKRKRIQKRS